jgi:hypothetical protein
MTRLRERRSRGPARLEVSVEMPTSQGDKTAAERGRELREAGFSELRTFRVLNKEFPHLERRDLWIAAGADLGSGWPLWADRSSPKPVSIRNDPRKDRDS